MVGSYADRLLKLLRWKTLLEIKGIPHRIKQSVGSSVHFPDFDRLSVIPRKQGGKGEGRPLLTGHVVVFFFLG